MKITGVKSTASAALCRVELQTDGGLTGIAIVPSAVGAALENIVNGILLGMDPRAVASAFQAMSGTDAMPEAIAALDIALWDLKAKMNGEPLWKTLGGMRPRANAYTSASDLSGFHEAELKLGEDLSDDIRRLGEMRDTLSDSASEPVLMIDAGGAWTADDAIEKVAAIEEEFDITWVSAPVKESDIQGLRQVSQQVFAAVCAGRYLHRISDYLPYFQSQALDVVAIDIARTGITGALQIADMAYGLELPVTLCASPGNLGAHVAGAMPNFMSLEIADVESTGGPVNSEVRVENGRALAGDAPGHGIRIDTGASQ